MEDNTLILLTVTKNALIFDKLCQNILDYDIKAVAFDSEHIIYNENTIKCSTVQLCVKGDIYNTTNIKKYPENVTNHCYDMVYNMSCFKKSTKFPGIYSIVVYHLTSPMSEFLPSFNKLMSSNYISIIGCGSVNDILALYNTFEIKIKILIDIQHLAIAWNFPLSLNNLSKELLGLEKIKVLWNTYKFDSNFFKYAAYDSYLTLMNFFALSNLNVNNIKKLNDNDFCSSDEDFIINDESDNIEDPINEYNNYMSLLNSHTQINYKNPQIINTYNKEKNKKYDYTKFTDDDKKISLKIYKIMLNNSMAQAKKKIPLSKIFNSIINSFIDFRKCASNDSSLLELLDAHLLYLNHIGKIIYNHRELTTIK